MTRQKDAYTSRASTMRDVVTKDKVKREEEKSKWFLGEFGQEGIDYKIKCPRISKTQACERPLSALSIEQGRSVGRMIGARVAAGAEITAEVWVRAIYQKLSSDVDARRRVVVPEMIDMVPSISIQVDPLARFRQLAASTPTGEKPRVLITGSLGQLGRGLATMLRLMYGEDSVVMTDSRKLRADETDVCNYHYLDILNEGAIDEAVVNGSVNTLIHLSAVGEQNVALEVDCQGVHNILEIAKRHSLKVFIPSTIGAFGPETPRVDTPDVTVQRPKTIYEKSKVCSELLGEYYHHRFGVDFRSLRFPGIISATKPGGGTTDYAIKIFYDALSTGHHVCYLRPDTRLPMMYDTDCTASVLFFLAAQSSSLSMRTYNVTGFSFTPEEIAASIRKFMPDFRITYEICEMRQRIADSWPQSLNDNIARADWAWKNDYGLDQTTEIMIALIKREMAREKGEAPKAVIA